MDNAIWFTDLPIGRNTLEKMVREICEDRKIQGKKLTIVYVLLEVEGKSFWKYFWLNFFLAKSSTLVSPQTSCWQVSGSLLYQFFRNILSQKLSNAKETSSTARSVSIVHSKLHYCRNSLSQNKIFSEPLIFSDCFHKISSVVPIWHFAYYKRYR